MTDRDFFFFIELSVTVCFVAIIGIAVVLIELGKLRKRVEKLEK